MPCDQIRTFGVAIEAANFNLMVSALKADGWTVKDVETQSQRILYASKNGVSFSWGKGDAALQVRTYAGESSAQAIGNSVRQAYTRAAIQEAAKKTGFKTVSKLAGNNNRLTLKRRA